ncbi:MAG TPA: hypothetical protein VFR75_12100 [Solirubrobacterales bacterium]|nr:hypothetical protein [Solirubrobacterales bacterium]
MAPLLGLGDEECGKEKAEIDQNSVCFGDAQLNRPGPERRECREKRQSCDQSRGPVEGAAECRSSSGAQRQQHHNDSPNREPSDMTLAQHKATAGQPQAEDQGKRTYQRR